ncbi:hypothetical protein GRAQ_01367 [Rahnella aquatilis CIP 78.65 = ATCC 33071]|uniref:N(4)-acetylcytidine amidohydrolase n=2 Tax=Rahnella aquatilis TaxID=34038 RepID=H2J000_RAHAC|nr:hypothetical protein Rahaq2_2328 [Rahnella aquatilis CIP 78.65 = ATCC 33071]KFD10648.1 hypothetical protein GRAQ_01367 [Rahnella aquatilis CIP 78.65 = ATCC 33071]
MDNKQWIWQKPDWPQFNWDDDVVQPLLRQTRLKMGKLVGKVESRPGDEATGYSLEAMVNNILASSEIENERLDAHSVRSSLAKRLGIAVQPAASMTERSEGLAKMMMDVFNPEDVLLSEARLFQWHCWLFAEPAPSYLRRGQWRGDDTMRVVSGRVGHEKVHYQAPPREQLTSELLQFIEWYNLSLFRPALDPLLRAALAHFWFITLHPFEDGNGRITRALTDMALFQADHDSVRLYAMSEAILTHRNRYYDVLEKTQRGDMDLTPWLSWFLQMLESTVDTAIQRIDLTLDKSRFWQIYHASNLSAGQIKVLNRLLDGGEKGFAEGINASQYQKVAKVSKATATRHLADLISRGCLIKSASGGRSTRYNINRALNIFKAENSMKNITFYGRFEADILAGRKTITLREASDADFTAGDQVRVSRYEDDVFFCNIEIIAVTPVQFDDLNDQHAMQENMTLDELKQIISEIYPGLKELFMIEFCLR